MLKIPNAEAKIKTFSKIAIFNLIGQPVHEEKHKQKLQQSSIRILVKTNNIYQFFINLLMSQENGLIMIKNKERVFEKQRRIKIDISKTEYPLLRNIALNEVGWTLWGRKDQRGDANLFWSDTYVSQQLIKRLMPYQRINHFPNSHELGKKNLLTENIKRLKASFPNEYNFYPQTWILPDQADTLSAFRQEYEQKNKKKPWLIVKPVASSQGKGIYITKEVEYETKDPQIVQEYITNPLVIEGCKFDLRIYVFIKSLNPLKIFRYQEGLTRLSTVSYQAPNKQNKTNLNMHLTNYSINKFNPSFVQNKSIEECFVGHKRSLMEVFKYLQSIGCNSSKLQVQIDEIIVKTIFAAYPKLIQSYRQCRDHETETESVCFQILGFDIIIDDKFKPWLLEINHSPSFCTESPLDYVVKKYLILDTLILLNLNGEDKEVYLKHKPKEKEHSMKDKDAIRLKRISEDIFQDSHLGGYQKIYPCAKPVYSLIFKRIGEKKYKYVNSKKSEKPQSQFNETEGSNTNTQHSASKKRNSFTLYGHFKQIRHQLNQQCFYRPQSQQQSLKRHIFIERDKKKYIEPIKMHNVNISFYEQVKTYYSKGFPSKRSTPIDKPNISKHNPSQSLVFEPKTSEGFRQLKKLDHEIRARIEKMKLARIKIHKIHSKQKKPQSYSHRVMMNPLRCDLKQVRGQNKFI